MIVDAEKDFWNFWSIHFLVHTFLLLTALRAAELDDLDRPTDHDTICVFGLF